MWTWLCPGSFRRSFVSVTEIIPWKILSVKKIHDLEKQKFIHIYRISRQTGISRHREQPNPDTYRCPGFGPSSLETVGWLGQHVFRPSVSKSGSLEGRTPNPGTLGFLPWHTSRCFGVWFIYGPSTRTYIYLIGHEPFMWHHKIWWIIKFMWTCLWGTRSSPLDD